MEPQTVTPPTDTLAKTIKAKYPGVYDDVPDADLEKSVKAKYPGVYDDMPTTTTADAAKPPAARPSALDTFRARDPGMATLMDFGVGALRSVAGTVEGVRKIARDHPEVTAAVPGASALTAGPPIPASVTEPTNTAQKFGKFAGNLGQFFLPAGALKAGKIALSTGSGILDAMIGSSLEGASAAGIDAAQKGTVADVPKTFAITAGANGAAIGAMKALTAMGMKTEMALVKPTAADIKDGFNVSTIFKNKLGGSLGQTFDKTQARFTDLTGQLRAMLGKNRGAMQVNMTEALDLTAHDLTVGAAKTTGQNEAIQRVIEGFRKDLLGQFSASNGYADLATANEVKQAVGQLGAWMHGSGGRVITDPDAGAKEIVANMLYAKLKDKIAAAAPGDIGAINRQLAELIPVQRAVIRRIPVEARSNPINLADMLSYVKGGMGLSIANRVLKSGTFANAAVTAGQSAASPGVIARTVGGTTAQIKKDE